jgi:hypothetical protein
MIILVIARKAKDVLSQVDATIESSANVATLTVDDRFVIYRPTNKCGSGRSKINTLGEKPPTACLCAAPDQKTFIAHPTSVC